MFKISIREWFLAVVIAAVGSASWVDRTNWQQRLLESENALSVSRQTLRESEERYQYVVHANGVLVKFMESIGSVTLPKEVYVEQPLKSRSAGATTASRSPNAVSR